MLAGATSRYHQLTTRLPVTGALHSGAVGKQGKRKPFDPLKSMFVRGLTIRPSHLLADCSIRSTAPWTPFV